VPEGWLGVYLDAERDQPVVVEVIPESPAAKAGLQVGDVIVRFADEAAPSRERVRALLAASQPGDRMEVLVRRGAGEQRVFVKLGERPAATTPKSGDGAGKPPRPAGPAAEPARSVPASPPPPATLPAPPADAPRTAAAAPGRVSAVPARDVDAEIAALRAELAELRRQVEELQRARRRE
jgi:membrane-associated protease RseP (regulator of RpoE activity)